MFNFLRKSLLRKFLFLLIILVTISLVTGAVLWRFQFEFLPIPFVYAGLLAIFAFISFLTYLSSVTRPLHKILAEIKAMLTGKKYNRIYTDRIDEWAVIGHFFNDVSKNLERIASTVEEGKRMSSELEIAGEIQKNILPKAMPDVPGLDIYANTRAAVEVGGDSYDFIRTKKNTFVYIGDATGHGVPAGLVMTMVNTLVHAFCEVYESGYEVLVQINRHLKPRIRAAMFMTVNMLRFDEQEKKLYITGAGHGPVLHFQKALEKCEIQNTGGIAIGMVPDNSKILKEELVSFQEGDVMTLYSDGIVEAKNTKGEMFGVSRLKETIEKFAPMTKTSQELFTSISTDFANFVENQTQLDDITLIVIRKT